MAWKSYRNLNTAVGFTDNFITTTATLDSDEAFRIGWKEIKIDFFFEPEIEGPTIHFPIIDGIDCIGGTISNVGLNDSTMINVNSTDGIFERPVINTATINNSAVANPNITTGHMNGTHILDAAIDSSTLTFCTLNDPEVIGGNILNVTFLNSTLHSPVIDAPIISDPTIKGGDISGSTLITGARIEQSTLINPTWNNPEIINATITSPVINGGQMSATAFSEGTVALSDIASCTIKDSVLQDVDIIGSLSLDSLTLDFDLHVGGQAYIEDDVECAEIRIHINDQHHAQAYIRPYEDGVPGLASLYFPNNHDLQINSGSLLISGSNSFTITSAEDISISAVDRLKLASSDDIRIESNNGLSFKNKIELKQDGFAEPLIYTDSLNHGTINTPYTPFISASAEQQFTNADLMQWVKVQIGSKTVFYDTLDEVSNGDIIVKVPGIYFATMSFFLLKPPNSPIYACNGTIRLLFPLNQQGIPTVIDGIVDADFSTNPITDHKAGMSMSSVFQTLVPDSAVTASLYFRQINPSAGIVEMYSYFSYYKIG
jgi:hypothetical protein